MIFPDSETPPGKLGADSPREIFCCRSELPTIARWIKSRLSDGTADELGADGIRAFEELLAKPFTLRVPLGHYLDDDDQVIAALTPQQFHILDSVGHLNRVAAGGGAGTGKTILAMEDAVRLAQRGLRTALICYSEPLAAYMRKKLSKVVPSVGVWSLGALCSALSQDAGYDCEATNDVERRIECLMKAVRAKPSLKFDAIVVDEAQDFRTHWWIAIEEAVKDHEASWLHAYFDTNQSVYGDLAKELAAFKIVPIHLTRNLRNTRNIHETASRFYRGIPITADGPEGLTVEWLEVSSGEIHSSAVAAARRLIKEKVVPGEIVVLTAEEESGAVIRNRTGFPEGVEVSTIRNFKGLERKVIILATSRELADEAELAYVALSRARTHLVVVGEKQILAWLKAH
ncbi:MAG: ATP-binding domain-containing protein [Rhizomicrobium sp.]